MLWESLDGAPAREWRAQLVEFENVGELSMTDDFEVEALDEDTVSPMEGVEGSQAERLARELVALQAYTRVVMKMDPMGGAATKVLPVPPTAPAPGTSSTAPQTTAPKPAVALNTQSVAASTSGLGVQPDKNAATAATSATVAKPSSLLASTSEGRRPPATPPVSIFANLPALPAKPPSGTQQDPKLGSTAASAAPQSAFGGNKTAPSLLSRLTEPQASQPSTSQMPQASATATPPPKPAASFFGPPKPAPVESASAKFHAHLAGLPHCQSGSTPLVTSEYARQSAPKTQLRLDLKPAYYQLPGNKSKYTFDTPREAPRAPAHTIYTYTEVDPAFLAEDEPAAQPVKQAPPPKQTSSLAVRSPMELASLACRSLRAIVPKIQGAKQRRSAASRKPTASASNTAHSFGYYAGASVRMAMGITKVFLGWCR